MRNWSPIVLKAMRDVVSIPGDGKTRIGIDDQGAGRVSCDFIDTVSGQGECEMFIIHARKARFWLARKKKIVRSRRWITRASISCAIFRT